MSYEPQLDFEAAADGGPRPLTVSELTRLVRAAIASALPGLVTVVGEISNFKHHSSGHLYFTLKDGACELACVMWRSDARRLRFDPQDGLEVHARGEVTVFERAGRYQLYVRGLEPRGTGALELAFRQLHERLQGEGLFETLPVEDASLDRIIAKNVMVYVLEHKDRDAANESWQAFMKDPRWQAARKARDQRQRSGSSWSF